MFAYLLGRIFQLREKLHFLLPKRTNPGGILQARKTTHPPQTEGKGERANDRTSVVQTPAAQIQTPVLCVNVPRSPGCLDLNADPAETMVNPTQMPFGGGGGSCFPTQGRDCGRTHRI